jgi:N utilization substance protein B
MIKPREVREAAMQLLFAHDLNGELRDEDVAVYWSLHSAGEALRKRAEKLAHDVIKHLSELDELIAGAVQNYSFERINIVDKNILRIAVYELLHLPDVPPRVVMNEAIEIARRFATEESGRFVNGVVDRIAKTKLGPDALQRRDGPPKPKAAPHPKS